MRGNRIGVVLAGTGAFAPRHARAVAATEGLKLVAVVSRDRHRAEALARSHGAEGTDDLSAALARDDVGMLAVVTEHDRHVPLLEAAADARRHALVEKPIAIDVEAGAAALSGCEDAGVTVGCVFQRRFDPAFVELKEAIAGGRTGAALAVELSLVARRDAEYFGSQQPAQAWRGAGSRAGGGVVMMQAIHLLDVARWLLGEVEEVEGVVARRRVSAEVADVEDVAAAVLRFESGAVGSFFATTAAAGALATRAAFHFERGSTVVEAERRRGAAFSPPRSAPFAPRWSARLRRSLAKRIRWRLVPRDPGPKGSLADVYADFRDAVREGRSPRASGRDALRSVQLVQELYRAAEEGVRVRIPPSGKT